VDLVFKAKLHVYKLKITFNLSVKLKLKLIISGAPLGHLVVNLEA